jgi:prepilin-type N-terminal cleavage/methylation domain-containing protein
VSSKAKGQGFSLLEILVVLVVLGILLGISGFLLSGYLRQQRLNEATRFFGETLRRVAETATGESQGYKVTLSGSTVSWQPSLGSGTAKSQTLPNGVTLTSPVTTFNFTGRGILEGTGQSFTVSLADQDRTVYLAPTGAVMYP